MIHNRLDYQKRIIDTAGKIGEDEPVFLFRATDITMPVCIEAAADIYDARGADPVLGQSMRKFAGFVRTWQAANREKVKTPDVDVDQLRMR